MSFGAAASILEGYSGNSWSVFRMFIGSSGENSSRNESCVDRGKSELISCGVFGKVELMLELSCAYWESGI